MCTNERRKVLRCACFMLSEAGRSAGVDKGTAVHTQKNMHSTFG